MTKIEYSTEEQLQELHSEALHVLHNLRHYTKEWEDKLGHAPKMNKKYWERRADDLVNKYGINEVSGIYGNQIEIIKTESV